MKKALIAIIAVGALAVILVALSSSGGKPVNSNSTPVPASITAISANDWVEGDQSAKAVLIEYSDFQCPACGAYYPLVKQLHREFGDRLAIVYRNFPLSQHANALPAAKAAEAAGKQNKFWEMHNQLFENQRVWSRSSKSEDIFEQYAAALGLDKAKFDADFKSAAIKEKIQSDLDGGLKAGVDGTPAFFLNGQRLSNPQSYEQFRTIIAASAASSL